MLANVPPQLRFLLTAIYLAILSNANDVKNVVMERYLFWNIL